MASFNRAYIIPDGSDPGHTLDVKILDITPQPTNRVTQAPVQTGLMINDHKVRNPLKVKVKCSLKIDNNHAWQTTYAEILAMYDNMEKKRLSWIQSHIGQHRNMALISCPHSENIESYDVFVFDLDFQEIMEIGSVQNDVVSAAPANSSTKDGGTK